MIFTKKFKNKLIVNVFGDIDCGLFHDFDKEEAGRILDYSTDTEITEIELRLDTCGGNVVSAFAVANAIKAFPKAQKTAYVLGSCMSAGVPLLLSCDKRVGGENAFFMIHAVSSWAFGNSAALNKTVEDLKVYDTAMFDEIKKAAKVGEKELLDLWENETIFNTADALKYGFITEVAKSDLLTLAAYSPFSKILNANKELTAQVEELTAQVAAFSAIKDDGEKTETETETNFEAIIQEIDKKIAANTHEIVALKLQFRNADNPTIPTFTGTQDEKQQKKTDKTDLKRILGIYK
ncbi:MAG: ATP-dependent Clp protease proteolytic subunit [Chitinivibrionia bacterium]|nr:ATP-dependent Clp protease proteolytic subunit [Chitinivibrionia bacterium]